MTIEKKTAPSAEVKQRFQRLVRRWRQETEHLSSVARMADHPAYREIVARGWLAVPLLLGELRRRPDFWFAALWEITGEDPVLPDQSGDIDEMARSWVAWGQERGHLQ